MDRNYTNLEEFQGFPIPNSAILEEESSTPKTIVEILIRDIHPYFLSYGN